MASGQFALAVEELKRFRASFVNLLSVAEYLEKMPNPADLQAGIERLKAQQDSLIANYRKTAEAQAQPALRAAELKVKQLLDDAEKQAETIKADARKAAQDEAKAIVEAAKQQASQLAAKVKSAHDKVQETLR